MSKDKKTDVNTKEKNEGVNVQSQNKEIENKPRTNNAANKTKIDNRPELNSENTKFIGVMDEKEIKDRKKTLFSEKVRSFVREYAKKSKEYLDLSGYNETFVNKVLTDSENEIRYNVPLKISVENFDLSKTDEELNNELISFIEPLAKEIANTTFENAKQAVILSNSLLNNSTANIEFADTETKVISLKEVNANMPVKPVDLKIRHIKIAPTLELAKTKIQSFAVDKQYLGYNRNLLLAIVDHARLSKDEFGGEIVYGFKVKYSVIIPVKVTNFNVTSMIKAYMKAILCGEIVNYRENENQRVLNSYGYHSQSNFVDFFKDCKNCNLIGVTDKNGYLIPDSLQYIPCLNSTKLAKLFDISGSLAYRLVTEKHLKLDDNNVSVAINNWVNDRIKEIEFIRICGKEIERSLSEIEPEASQN